MKRGSRIVPWLAWLLNVGIALVAHADEVMDLPLDHPIHGRIDANSFMIDGSGLFWLSSKTGILCFNAEGQLRNKLLTTAANFAVGDSHILVFPVSAAGMPKGPQIEVSPDAHVDIYSRSEPETKWMKTLWEPAKVIQGMVFQPMSIDRNGHLWFRERDFAVCVNENLELLKQQPKKFLNPGSNRLLYETELIWNTTELPWKEDRWELRIYDQGEKLITVETDRKSGFGLVRDGYGVVRYVICGTELRGYSQAGARSQTVKVPPHSRTGRIGSDGNYYFTDIRGKRLVIVRSEIPKR